MRHKRLPLQWENALEGVSEELYDEVEPCSFPSLQLRFRNDRFLGGNNRNDDDNISDEKLVRYFGGWEDIGDDRGFLIGQIRAADGKVHLSLDGVDARQSVGKAASCEYYMNITGEAFDCGPFAFMEFYNPRFTAAYFDMELPKPEEGMPLELGNAAIPLFHVRGENGAGKGFRGQL